MAAQAEAELERVILLSGSLTALAGYFWRFFIFPFWRENNDDIGAGTEVDTVVDDPPISHATVSSSSLADGEDGTHTPADNPAPSEDDSHDLKRDGHGEDASASIGASGGDDGDAAPSEVSASASRTNDGDGGAAGAGGAGGAGAGGAGGGPAAAAPPAAKSLSGAAAAAVSATVTLALAGEPSPVPLSHAPSFLLLWAVLFLVLGGPRRLRSHSQHKGRAVAAAAAAAATSRAGGGVL